jgi:hypothetical protein
MTQLPYVPTLNNKNDSSPSINMSPYCHGLCLGTKLEDDILHSH